MSDLVCEYEVSREGVSKDGDGLSDEVWMGRKEVGQDSGGGG